MFGVLTINCAGESTPDESPPDESALLAEYEAAFERYRECIRSAGAEVFDVEVDELSKGYTWGVQIGSASNEQIEACYNTVLAEAEQRLVRRTLLDED